MNNVYDTGIHPCCSCGVCAAACPHQAITIQLDSDGFYRPVISIDICIECGLCKDVCYKYSTFGLSKELKNIFQDKTIYGAWSNREEIVKSTTSGGVGHEFLEFYLKKSYKSCGVIYDAKDNKCRHVVIDSVDDLDKLKTSKYLQSDTFEAFSSLKNEGKYIVIGTPCQIHGLRQLIRRWKREDDFILIDFFCFGTPSFLLWEKYENYIKKQKSLGPFTEVCFRSKASTSWHSYAVKVTDNAGKSYLRKDAANKDLFMKIFLSETCLNESCYKCMFRLDSCFSDIRLGDFWGEKYKENENGVTLVAINTEKGRTFFDDVSFSLHVDTCTFSDLQKAQPKRFHTIMDKRRSEMIQLLQSNLSLLKIYRRFFNKKYRTLTLREWIHVRILYLLKIA
jgi:coenzyme F420-reducing hydrogenase beta subunit